MAVDDFLFLGVIQADAELIFDMETMQSATVVKDLSGNGNHGTISGTTTRNRRGGWGQSLDFDGTTGVINVSDAASLDASSAITVMAWVQLDINNVNYQRIVSKFAGAPLQGYGFRINSAGKVEWECILSGVADTLTSNAVIPVSTWTHITCTWQPGTNAQRIFINGAEDASRTPGNASIGNSTGNLTVGASTADFTNGRIDEVYIYSRVLGTVEILAVAKAPEVRLTSPDGFIKIPLMDVRVTMDMTRNVTVAAIPGNTIIDIDLRIFKRTFTIQGNMVKYGSGTAVENMSALEKLVMVKSTDVGGQSGTRAKIGGGTETNPRLVLHWGRFQDVPGITIYGNWIGPTPTHGGAWKTYFVRVLKFTPMYDSEQSGGAGLIYPFSLQLVEGGTLTETGQAT